MSSFSLAKKITATIGLVLAFFAILGIVSFWAVSSLNNSFGQFSKGVDEGNIASEMTETALAMQSNINEFLSTNDSSLESNHNEMFDELNEYFEQVTAAADQKEFRELLSSASELVKGYDQAFHQIVELCEAEQRILSGELIPAEGGIKSNLKEMLAADQSKGDIAGAFAISGALQSAFEVESAVNRYIVSFDNADSEQAIELSEKLSTQIEELWSDYSMNVEFDESLKDASKEASLKEVMKHGVTMTAALQSLTDTLSRISDINRNDLLPVGPQFIAKIDTIKRNISEKLATLKDRAESRQATVNFLVITISLSGLCIGSFVSWKIIRGITTQINGIVSRLETTAFETFGASQKVSSNSEALARDSSEQAAAIEETSSSLEEVNSMAEKNAQNAESAKKLATEARVAAESGAESMKDMVVAMHEIKESSDNIANIIKTIDEIAFQTNILALNAAVEAARAGESGAGFAVVADEVRSLAHRSAEAASVTARKIENSVEKSERGVELNQRVADNLQTIVEHTQKMDEIVAQISDASIEQNKGVTLIQNSITQMDEVTQRNAEGAAGTASSSKTLLNQSHDLQGSIQDLGRIINGGNGHLPKPAERTSDAVASEPQVASNNRIAATDSWDDDSFKAVPSNGRGMDDAFTEGWDN